MDFHNHEYVHATGITRAIPDGETEYVCVDYDNEKGWVLHESEEWARAEQALLQEQRDAQIAREKEERLVTLVDNVLNQFIPSCLPGQIPQLSGTLAIRQCLIRNLRESGYIQ